MKHQISYLPFNWKNSGIDGLLRKYDYALDDYLRRLMWWNRKINLVSRSVSRETLVKHIEHSLTICSLDEIENTRKIVDAGTGGGLPGIPLAIALPKKDIVLNDIVEKKIMAVKQIVLQLGLSDRVKCVASSVEQLNESNFVLVSKHAFKVNEIYPMVKGQNWSSLVLLKGRNEVEQELDGIGDPLEIRIYDLYENRRDEFYEGKALVLIKRK